MPIYTSQIAAAKSTLPSRGEPEEVTSKRLTSCILTRSPELQEIIDGTRNLLTVHRFDVIEIQRKYHKDVTEFLEEIPVKVDEQYRTTYSGSFVADLRNLFFLLIQADRFHPLDYMDWEGNFIITGEDYDEIARKLVIAYQKEHGLSVDGIVGGEILLHMDAQANEIGYYDCETGELYHDASKSQEFEDPVITRVYRDAKIFPTPNDKTHDPMIVLNALESKVYIISDLGEEQKHPDTGQHWYYVMFDSGNSATTAAKNRSYGYMLAWNVLNLKSMPDPDAELKKIVSTDTIYEIIVETYYHSDGGGVLKTDFDTEMRTEKPELNWYNPLVAIEMYNYFKHLKEYNTYKFYVNLLLFSNNPKVKNHSNASVYLDTPESLQIVEDDFGVEVSDINPFENPAFNPDDPRSYDDSLQDFDPGMSNYDYFLKRLKDDYSQAHWEWDPDPSNPPVVKIKDGFHMWVPSKNFADKLYLYVNNHQSKLATYHNNIRNTIRNEWERGFGVEIKGRIGATFGIPVRVEGGGSVWLSRKYTADDNEVIMVLKKFGTIQGGLDAGVGAGFYAGSGTKSKHGANIGLQLHAQAQGYGRLECYTEYEFELYDISSLDAIGRRDLSSIALFSSLLNVTGMSPEFGAVQFVKAFTDYNIDPMNYLTRFDIRFVAGGEASAGVFTGINLGNTLDKDYWQDVLDNGAPSTPSSHESPPWLVSKLISMLYASAGINLGGNFTVGYEYTAQYDDKCFNKSTGSRVPKSFQHSLHTSGQIFKDISASAFSINLLAVESSPFVGVKLSQEYFRGDYLGGAESIYFDPKKTRFNSTPKLEFNSGGGNWDSYENSASEYGICLKQNLNTNPSSSSSAISNIDYLYIKKRFRLVSFAKGGLKDLTDLQDKMKNFFGKDHFKKLGYNADAFLDVEVRIENKPDNNGINHFDNIIAAMTTLFDNVRQRIADTQTAVSGQTVTVSTIDWFDVLLSFPRYLSLLSGSVITDSIKNLVRVIIQSLKLYSFSFRGKIGFGGGAGLKLAAGFKAALDLQAVLSITFDQAFIDEKVWIEPDNLLDPEHYDVFDQMKTGFLENQSFITALLEFSGDEVNKY